MIRKFFAGIVLFALCGSVMSAVRPNTPENVFPAVSADLVQGSDVEFVWQSDPNVVTYQFHIFDNVAKNTTPYVSDLAAANICSGGTCRLSHPVTQPVATRHAWRVRGFNSAGPSEWSRSLFSVISSPVVPDPEPEPEPDTNLKPETPVNLSPAVAAELNRGTDVEFIWQRDPDVATYEFHLFDNVAKETTPWVAGLVAGDICSQSECRFTYPVTQPVSTYHAWRVRGRNSQGLSEWSRSIFTVVVTTVNPDPDPDPDPVSPGVVTKDKAARLLTQATFGPTRADIAQVQSVGVESWIDRQMTLRGESQFAYVRKYSNGSNREFRHETWWKSAVDGEDQLRQRVAFALSQLFVISDTGYTLANAQYGVTSYYQMLLDNAFGNYREILEQVTLHPVMGLYLSMLQNSKGDEQAGTRPDENYAREVLQLFTIGLYELAPDGSTQGNPVFTQDQIEAFARVFTGWNYDGADRWNKGPYTGPDKISQMQPFEDYHDTGEKVLLNYGPSTVHGQLPAGGSAREDLEKALDNIFYHPNVGPFVVKQLIKRLVTSNPSLQYVRDIAAVFDDDGAGTRGNMKAVIKALLMHDEARNIPDFAAYGKLREPVLRISHLWRAFGVLPGSQSSSQRNEYHSIRPELKNLEMVTGQAPLKSASVFNFFQPGFSPAGPIADQNLKAPEFELFTESNELSTSNFIGRQIQRYSVSSIADSSPPLAFLNFTYEVGIAGDVNALLDHLDTVLVAGNMSTALRTLLSEHLLALPSTQPGRFARVRDAVTLIMASPDYLVQM